LLGFEVPGGEPVFLSVHHLAIFGMTQLSGKTTALEALISRSGLKAIAFKTKRGEAGFTKYNLVTPYYKPRADWQFVEGLVNVALGEKVKYEPGMRYAIMKVCRGRKDLREIRQAAVDMAKESRREFMKSVYEKLAAYLDIVVPELEKWPFSEKLELQEGVNVMDLASMRLETQHLVIASTIEYAFSFLDHIVVIIPEAWETIPQGKMTPVKWVAQQFIRKGAAIGNYLWLDSQDIGGIDKTPLRQCDNWLMGRMKEAHEVERILKQLLGMKVPAEEIQTLPLGTFYAAIGNEVKKTYVLPAGVPEDVGRKVARGELAPEYVRDNFLKRSRVLEEQDEMVYKEKYEQLQQDFKKRVEEERQKAFGEAMAKIEEIKKQWNIDEYQQTIAKLKDDKNVLEKGKAELLEELSIYEGLDHFFERLIQRHMPTSIPTSIPTNQPTEASPVVGLQSVTTVVNVPSAVKRVTIPTDTVKGKVFALAKPGFFDAWKTAKEVHKRLIDDANYCTYAAVNEALNQLVKDGLFGMKHTDRNRFKLAPNVTFAEKEVEAK